MDTGPLLQISPDGDGRSHTLRLSGELDVSTSPLLIDAFARAVDQHPAKIDVDLCSLTYVDSVGLSVFATAHYQCLDAGITLQFRNPNVFIRRILVVTGLAEVLSLATDELVPA